MACPEGIEPPTTCLEGRCSIQLSYGQIPGWREARKINDLDALPSVGSGGFYRVPRLDSRGGTVVRIRVGAESGLIGGSLIS